MTKKFVEPPTPRPTELDTAEQAIIRAVQALAGVCNGARSWDGAGFNKADTDFGHTLAERLQHRQLTPRELAAAYRLCRRYEQTQLWGAGIVLPDNVMLERLTAEREQIRAAPSRHATALTSSTTSNPTSSSASRCARVDPETSGLISLEHGKLVVRFPYNAALADRMRQVRHMHKGEWKPELNKAHVFPNRPEALKTLRNAFPQFTLTPEVVALIAPEQTSLFELMPAPEYTPPKAGAIGVAGIPTRRRRSLRY